MRRLELVDERGITYVSAKNLPGSDEGEFIAKNVGNLRDLNDGIYVGELSDLPIVQKSVEIIIYKLQ